MFAMLLKVLSYLLIVSFYLFYLFYYGIWKLTNIYTVIFLKFEKLYYSQLWHHKKIYIEHEINI